jgi:radical SAM superfamily enzyme YgiQ (UPF0313 family)
MSRSLRYEIGPIRPPNEAYSLLVRFTRNCPWNRCTFCHIYKGRKFERRSLDEIKSDIDTVKTISDAVRDLSWHRGLAGAVTEGLVQDIYSSGSYNDCSKSVSVWLFFGGKNVFIQDANSLVMKVDDLVEALKYLRETFPSVDRVTTYARSQTIAQRLGVDDLIRIREAGLTRIHIGLESGSDRVLKFMDKGVTKEQHITAGRRVKDAGIELSEYVVPGLGGKEWSLEHAIETADALNKIDPDFIRFRTLKVTREMLLYHKLDTGEFDLKEDEEILREIRLIIEKLDGITSQIKSDHILNLLEEVDGRLPQDKGKILGIIDRYFNLSAEERLVYRMGRRAGVYRGLDDLQDAMAYRRIQAAIQEMEQNEPGSAEKSLSLLLENYI